MVKGNCLIFLKLLIPSFRTPNTTLRKATKFQPSGIFFPNEIIGLKLNFLHGELCERIEFQI